MTRGVRENLGSFFNFWRGFAEFPPRFCVEPRRVLTCRLLTNLLSAAMMKPSNNNSPGGNQTETDEDTDEERQDDGWPNGSHPRSAINVDLKQQLTDERKKRVRAERAAAGLKTKLQTSEVARARLEATRAASCKKLRGEISLLKLKETAAVTAASTSSKILDDASKEVIVSKSKCIRDLRKQVAEQLKTISNGKALQGKVDRLKAELEAIVKEKSAWTKEKNRVSKSNLSLEKMLDRQTTAKHAHQQKMAEIALDGKRLGLEQSKQRQAHADDKQKTITEGKKELVRFNHKKRDKSKIADLKRKDDAKAKKLKTHAERIQAASSDMLRTSRLNGGSFPSPALNVQEAHAHLQQDAPLRLSSRMTQVEQPVANAGGSGHNPAHAQSQEEDAPWKQSTMTQAHAPQLEQPAANSKAGKDLEPAVVLPPG
jgi:hypothetical protein